MLKSNLKIDNRFSLIGTVVSQPKRHQSPSGIAHCQFWLEHRSQQQEAGLARQAWCKIPIQLSGHQLTSKTQGITVGSKVCVSGFIHSHKTSQGLDQLVLHAEQIEFID
ncbi:primosomal replication protein N [Gallibacterium salpingitidis]|uniref:Replication restart protein PriB n=1 Tax=Gallibacterium salpingitidis TaxID=505341 RepID=A0A1A7QAS8_9PAST|nr:primosomal replication protein N [Gallibacterium salpingitidis]OBW96099.1 primosomal replication protein N [Gallibacterium salpingitidis]OBX06727.1 primosomal replication protein N [Gallibacterium salpingitidis]OBX10505.1 primosomal replication protein N [Gallibacterium salpingitidis]WKS99947.1 primosomal replication protein N [Gallibacterium salpingitidis]